MTILLNYTMVKQYIFLPSIYRIMQRCVSIEWNLLHLSLDGSMMNKKLRSNTKTVNSTKVYYYTPMKAKNLFKRQNVKLI